MCCSVCDTPVACNHSRQHVLPLPTSFTRPLLHERYAGPFLGTHAGLGWGPRCPRPLLAGRRHAWTHQLRIRLLLLGRSQGPRCSPQLQMATSVCVRRDEKRRESGSAVWDQRGPRCTLGTAPCCLNRREGQNTYREAGEGDAPITRRLRWRNLKTGRNGLMFVYPWWAGGLIQQAVR